MSAPDRLDAPARTETEQPRMIRALTISCFVWGAVLFVGTLVERAIGFGPAVEDPLVVAWCMGFVGTVVSLGR